MQHQADLLKKRINGGKLPQGSPQPSSSDARASKRSYPCAQHRSTKTQANAGKKPKLECGLEDTVNVPARRLMDIVGMMDQVFDDVLDLDTAFSGAKRRALMSLDEARKAVAGLLVGVGKEPALNSGGLDGASSVSRISASVLTVPPAGSQFHPPAPRTFQLMKSSRGTTTSRIKQEPLDVPSVTTAAANNNPPSRKHHAPAPDASESDYCHAWITLLEYCAKVRCAFPTLSYEESGPSHQRQYFCTLTLNGTVYRPTQQSQTKKAARREAAVMALRAVLEI